MPFPLVAITEGGVRFTVEPLLRACLSTWRLCPCQLMPNSFKIIMGIAKLNQILEIDLGVHDIEDLYDLCKSPGAEYIYFLRVKANGGTVIGDLEDNSRYAGDDRVFVSGNWEMARDEPLAQRAYRIPRCRGVLPSNCQFPFAACIFFISA